MKNPTISHQRYIVSLLFPMCTRVGEAVILHYMDDMLVCTPNDNMLQHALDQVVKVLTSAGLSLQEEKVQRMSPWKYLDLEITARTIVSQKFAFNSDPKTSADLQSLYGTLNWIRPWLGLSTECLAPYFNLLKGREELSSPRMLTPGAKAALEKVEEMLKKRQAHR